MEKFKKTNGDCDFNLKGNININYSNTMQVFHSYIKHRWSGIKYLTFHSCTILGNLFRFFVIVPFIFNRDNDVICFIGLWALNELKYIHAKILE